jgi:hypothetical protein
MTFSYCPCKPGHTSLHVSVSHEEQNGCRNAGEPEGVATCAWKEWAITGNDPEFGGRGSLDTGEDFHAAPDLDHTDKRVQAGLSDFAKCALLGSLPVLLMPCLLMPLVLRCILWV